MASMDVSKRRAYLYQKVIELLFSPLDEKAQKQWVIALGHSLPAFWQTDRAFTINAGKYELEAYLLNIACTCDIRGDGYFAVDFEILKENFPDIFSWSHHVDPVHYYRIPLRAFLGEQKRAALASIDETDVSVILDTLIFHPCEHMHLESCIPHDIRLGGGISNPYQYLFHLRYQFCPDSRMQEAERQRLSTLVFQAIQSDSAIDIQKLMEIPDS